MGNASIQTAKKTHHSIAVVSLNFEKDYKLIGKSEKIDGQRLEHGAEDFER